MVENAACIIFTSEAHREWLAERYTLPPSEVVHLRPLAHQLDFKPLPKLAGQNIVYPGGLTPHKQRDGLYGYRAYHDTFRRLQECGWTVHVYPAYGDPLVGDFSQMGCVMHRPVPQESLYRELSQYQAGLHGYALTGPQAYVKTCMPNKTWEYLAAGIPTFGFNCGDSGAVFDGRWGHIAKSHRAFASTTKRVLAMEVDDSLRRAEVMDSDAGAFDRLCRIAASHIPKPYTEMAGDTVEIRSGDNTCVVTRKAFEVCYEPCGWWIA